MFGTTSRRQLRCREAAWEGSPRQDIGHDEQKSDIRLASQGKGAMDSDAQNTFGCGDSKSGEGQWTPSAESQPERTETTGRVDTPQVASCETQTTQTAIHDLEVLSQPGRSREVGLAGSAERQGPMASELYTAVAWLDGVGLVRGIGLKELGVEMEPTAAAVRNRLGIVRMAGGVRGRGG